MSACPDCGRPIAPSYEAWIADKGPDDEHLSCAAHTNLDDEDMWGDEAIPDCRMATILRLRSQLATALARVAELTSQIENALDASKEGCWMARALDAERENQALMAALKPQTVKELEAECERLRREVEELRGGAMMITLKTLRAECPKWAWRAQRDGMGWRYIGRRYVGFTRTERVVVHAVARLSGPGEDDYSTEWRVDTGSESFGYAGWWLRQDALAPDNEPRNKGD